MTTFLFIDGTNLYAAQFELFGPTHYLHFPDFIKEVEKSLHVKFDEIYFYASYTPRKDKPTKREYAYITNEFLFYKSVKNTPHTSFFKGYRSKTSGKEKEVDVKLSVDLVGYGLLNKFDRGYLFTGDADFLQAALFLTKNKLAIKIQLLCLANKIMFKGLYHYPSIIIQFDNKEIKGINIAEKAEYISLKSSILVKEV